MIEEFIEENLPKLKPNDNVIRSFENYWSEHKQQAFEQLCTDENIIPEQFDKLLQTYQFANRLPRDQEIVKALSFQPKILERKSILERIADKIQDFINTYIEGMGGSVVIKNSSKSVRKMSGALWCLLGHSQSKSLEILNFRKRPLPDVRVLQKPLTILGIS